MTPASVSHDLIDRRSSHTPIQVPDKQEQSPSAKPEGEASRDSRFRHVFSAASPQSLVAILPEWLIVIWYGEELTL
jgi:hypothetical protein